MKKDWTPLTTMFNRTKEYHLGQRKAFYRKRIPEPSCARKESKEEREGPTVLHICFCNLSDNFK